MRILILFVCGICFVSKGALYSDTYPCSWNATYNIYPTSVRFECHGVPADKSASVYIGVTAPDPSALTVKFAIWGYDSGTQYSWAFIRHTYVPLTDNDTYIVVSSTIPMSASVIFIVKYNGNGPQMVSTKTFPCLWRLRMNITKPFRMECRNVPSDYSRFVMLIDSLVQYTGLFSATFSDYLALLLGDVACTNLSPCSSYHVNETVIADDGNSSITIWNEVYGSLSLEMDILFYLGPILWPESSQSSGISSDDSASGSKKSSEKSLEKSSFRSSSGGSSSHEENESSSSSREDSDDEDHNESESSSSSKEDSDDGGIINPCAMAIAMIIAMRAAQAYFCRV